VLFGKTARSARQPRPVQFLGEPIQWVQTARYLGVTLDTQPTWSAHFNQVKKRAAQWLGMLGPLINRRIFLSIRNSVLLHKQLIRPMMDFACPIWRSAAGSHVQKLQVLQSKCLRVATNATWYVCNRQIHEGFGDSILRRPHQSTNREFRLEVNWCGEPLSTATRKAPVPTEGWLKSPGKPGWSDVQQTSRDSP
jgi:hypothetical protein